MVLYLTIIIIANIIVILSNILFGTAIFGYSVDFVLFASIVTTLFQFAIDGIFALLVHWLPKKWFTKDKKCFYVSKKLQKFYDKLKIRKWKDKVWELGGLGGFRKNKIYDPNNPEYIDEFIMESNKGIVVHRLSYFAGYLAIFLFPLKYALVIGVPIATINLILNILPTMILQYNIPKLLVVHKRLTRNLELKNNEEKTTD